MVETEIIGNVIILRGHVELRVDIVDTMIGIYNALNEDRDCRVQAQEYVKRMNTASAKWLTRWNELKEVEGKGCDTCSNYDLDNMLCNVGHKQPCSHYSAPSNQEPPHA